MLARLFVAGLTIALRPRHEAIGKSRRPCCNRIASRESPGRICDRAARRHQPRGNSMNLANLASIHFRARPRRPSPLCFAFWRPASPFRETFMILHNGNRRCPRIHLSNHCNGSAGVVLVIRRQYRRGPRLCGFCPSQLSSSPLSSPSLISRYLAKIMDGNYRCSDQRYFRMVREAF